MYTSGYQTKVSERLPIDKVIVKNWQGHWSRMWLIAVLIHYILKEISLVSCIILYEQYHRSRSTILLYVLIFSHIARLRVWYCIIHLKNNNNGLSLKNLFPQGFKCQFDSFKIGPKPPFLILKHHFRSSDAGMLSCFIEAYWIIKSHERNFVKI